MFNKAILTIGSILSLVLIIFFTVIQSTRTENSFSSVYEDNNYKKNEIIASLRSDDDLTYVLNEFTHLGLKVKEKLIPEMGIYLLEYNGEIIPPHEMLIRLQSNRRIGVAQFNHSITQQELTSVKSVNMAQSILDGSLTPNDPNYPLQWNMNNTGQNGGTPDADIDAPEAWEIATGGNTTLGDTIVVALIGGGDFNEPDLTYWKNYNEVPDNGLDDDNNGYIDDVNGWNALLNNGNTTGEYFAINAAGIVGAKGNNGINVAGVNWKVKIMTVRGKLVTDDEATALRAYAYIYKQRKLYNETNGARGAFVVSSLASYGLTSAQPSNHPIWCAMFDSLGKIGVLSVASGPDAPINVDVNGYMPVSCSSEYLITVTNTTNTDEKNSNAGYGPLNMDIGAPGTNVYSKEYITGCGIASPHVSGAIALMYNAASVNLIQIGKRSPDSLAKYIKHSILTSVDTLSSLSNLVLSKGRLNLFKAVNKVRTSNIPTLHNFNLSSPPAGSVITVFPGSNTKYTFIWDTSATGASYRFIFGSPSAPGRQISLPSGMNSLSVTSGELDNLLAGLGVAAGNSISGTWDAWAYRQLPTVDSLKSQNGPRTITFTRGIPSLTPFNLLSPANGTSIMTSTFNNSDVNFSWSRSGDGTTYKWMFDSPTFSGNPFLIIPVQNDTMLSIKNFTFDLLLQQAGLNSGDSLAGQWRVYAYRSATDSIASSQSFALTLKRNPKGDVLVAYEANPLCTVSRDSITKNLTSLGITYDLFERGTNNSNNSISFRGYKKIIWLGEGTSIMSVGQRDSVKSYLNAGGTSALTKSKFIIFAEDVASILDRNGSGYHDTIFSRHYLGIKLVADKPNAVGGRIGIRGLSINTNQYDSCAGGFPDVICRSTAPYSINLYGFKFHTSPDSVSAIGRMTNNYNTVAFGVDIESLRNIFGGAESSPVKRILKATLDYVDQILVSTGENTSLVPTAFELKQNYPNPFNPVTKIIYSVPATGMVSIKVFDVTGKEVATLQNNIKTPGIYTADFNGAAFASGVYFYRLEAPGFIDTKRMVLVK
jgi:hypothetical protein